MDYFRDFIRRIRIWGFENVIFRFYSRYPAEVLDNVDPDEEENPRQRLKLNIPAIHEPLAGEWVDSGYVIAGDKWGFQSIPRVGDFVYVTFAYGDSNKPRWHHGWYGKDQKPDEFKNNKDTHGFISPGKQKVLLDDLNQTATIEQPNGSKVVMSEDDIIITFEGGETIKINGNKIYISDGGTQPIALGDETVTTINQLNAQVQAITAAITAFTAAQNTVASTSFPLVAPLIPGWTALGTAMAPITTALTGQVTTQTQLIPSKNSETK